MQHCSSSGSFVDLIREVCCLSPGFPWVQSLSPGGVALVKHCSGLACRKKRDCGRENWDIIDFHTSGEGVGSGWRMEIISSTFFDVRKLPYGVQRGPWEGGEPGSGLPVMFSVMWAASQRQYGFCGSFWCDQSCFCLVSCHARDPLQLVVDRKDEIQNSAKVMWNERIGRGKEYTDQSQ